PQVKVKVGIDYRKLTFLVIPFDGRSSGWRRILVNTLDLLECASYIRVTFIFQDRPHTFLDFVERQLGKWWIKLEKAHQNLVNICPRSTGQLIIKTLASTLRRSIYEQMVLGGHTVGTKCPRLHLIQIYLGGRNVLKWFVMRKP